MCKLSPRGGGCYPVCEVDADCRVVRTCCGCTTAVLVEDVSGWNATLTERCAEHRAHPELCSPEVRRCEVGTAATCSAGRCELAAITPQRSQSDVRGP